MPRKSFEENIIDVEDTAMVPEEKKPKDNKGAVKGTVRKIRVALMEALKSYAYKGEISKEEFNKKLSEIVSELNAIIGTI